MLLAISLYNSLKLADRRKGQVRQPRGRFAQHARVRLERERRDRAIGRASASFSATADSKQQFDTMNISFDAKKACSAGELSPAGESHPALLRENLFVFQSSMQTLQ